MKSNQENVPIGVGIIGLGRSGYGIHTKVLQEIKHLFSIKAVHDPNESRAEEVARELGVPACKSIDELLGLKEVEMVIVASPNPFHAGQAIKALLAGKHVLCEKPFGLSTGDVDKMIEASHKADRVLQAFQQRRYEPDFRKVKEILESKLLGDIHLIRICWHGFKRRWDWQTMTSMAGGSLNNNGPHPVDHALELFGKEDPHVWCEMRTVLCSGDGEDYLKIILTGKGKPTIEIELIDNAAYGHDRWWVSGSAGGLKGTADSLEWKWVDWSRMPERQVQLASTPDRSYNSEALSWSSDSWKAQGEGDGGAGSSPAMQPALDLYTDLWKTIRENVPQKITPQEVRRRILILEKARAAAGRPLNKNLPGQVN